MMMYLEILTCIIYDKTVYNTNTSVIKVKVKN
jgi:hypothetical protein